LQQGLDDLALLAARVAGVLLGSHPSIVREQLKIVNTFLEVVQVEVLRAFRTTGAIVSWVMPRRLAPGDPSHWVSSLAPFDVLQPIQQSAMFSMVAIDTSLMMCSQERFFARSVPKSQPQ
ncbi:hypothetical protein, partial [Comamonas aquatica]|uniref:hypothetical protein n=1 Tax=Comamonas aquatica TaxID=225991 RepID=UPI0034D61EC6